MSSAAWESLHKATLELAKSAALKQRLTDAFTRYLLDMSPSEMPRELRADFEALHGDMTRIRPQHGESAVAATVRKMSMGEADACAARIVLLLDALHRFVAVNQARPSGQALTRQLAAVEPPTARVPMLISVNRV